MIRIKGSKDYLIALESVAMTDIVMNLFIFFFISFSILYTFNPDRMTNIEVNLPTASSAQAIQEDEHIVITIPESGELYIGEKRVPSAQLKKHLKSALEARPQSRVILKVDKGAAFNSVAKTLDVINELRIRKVSIATIKETEQEKAGRR